MEKEWIFITDNEIHPADFEEKHSNVNEIQQALLQKEILFIWNFIALILGFHVKNLPFVSPSRSQELSMLLHDSQNFIRKLTSIAWSMLLKHINIPMNSKREKKRQCILWKQHLLPMAPCILSFKDSKEKTWWCFNLVCCVHMFWMWK